MSRLLLILGLFLLAGAVVNVAVAWGFAVCIPMPAAPGINTSVLGHFTGRPRWQVAQQAVPGALRISFTASDFEMDSIWPPRATPPVPSWSKASTGPTWDEYRSDVLEQARGWPLLSLYYRTTVNAHEWKEDWQLVIPWTGTYVRERRLPLALIWPGFAVNTLLYAAILWPLIRGPFALRRLICRRRGLCVKCGYPVGESGSCTECGAALPGRPAT